MNKSVKDAEQHLQRALQDLEAHEAEHGAEPADSGQQQHRARLVRILEKSGEAFERAKADGEAEEATRAARMERVREAAKDPRNVENGFGGAPTHISARSVDPWADDIRSLGGDEIRSRAMTALERTEEASTDGADRLAAAIETDGAAAAMVVARSNPAYRSAFDKLIRNPERAHLAFTDAEARAVNDIEAARAAISTNVNSGGYLIPLSLDPAVILTNAGTANPFRRISKVVQAPVSPHRVVISAGSNAQWLAENTANTDASPTFDKLDISLFKQSQWITGSYEIIQDGALLAANIAEVAMDARERLESDAFAVGSGSGAPYGVVTRVAAVTASRVSPTTGGVFTANSVADVHRTFDALPARARQSASLAWIGNNAVYSLIRQMSPSTNGGNFWTDLGGAIPSTLLGASRYESSVMASSMTTGSNAIVIGDFQKFTIVDHVGGPSLEYVANVVDGSGIPTGTRGWIYWHRVGSDVTDSSQFRLLQL